jgi:hypothetical protein
MKVHDYVLHLGIVNGPLRVGSPRVLRARIIREQADQVNLVEIDEIQSLRITHATAEHQVHLTHFQPLPNENPGLAG